MKYHEQIDPLRGVVRHLARARRDGACVGAVAREVRTGNMEVLAAKNVILASGGAGQCFKPTTNALICTGDGIAQAYRVGAPLMDMEMIQYHPTTLVENGFLITEGARGEGAHLLNATASASWRSTRRTRWSSPRATSSRAPSRPRSTRAAASARRRRHRARHHGRAAQAHARGAARDRQHRQGLRGRRHHARADPDPPRASTTSWAGSRPTSTGATSIPGLYAAGEVACVSVHAATASARTRCWTR
jgi:succinate dehydrogenase / fumarate reductase flavoprotein subunit